VQKGLLEKGPTHGEDANGENRGQGDGSMAAGPDKKEGTGRAQPSGSTGQDEQNGRSGKHGQNGWDRENGGSEQTAGAPRSARKESDGQSGQSAQLQAELQLASESFLLLEALAAVAPDPSGHFESKEGGGHGTKGGRASSGVWGTMPHVPQALAPSLLHQAALWWAPESGLLQGLQGLVISSVHVSSSRPRLGASQPSTQSSAETGAEQSALAADLLCALASATHYLASAFIFSSRVEQQHGGKGGAVELTARPRPRRFRNCRLRCPEGPQASGNRFCVSFWRRCNGPELQGRHRTSQPGLATSLTCSLRLPGLSQGNPPPGPPHLLAPLPPHGNA